VLQTLRGAIDPVALSRERDRGSVQTKDTPRRLGRVTSEVAPSNLGFRKE